MEKSSKSKIKLYNPDEPYATCVSFKFPMEIACSVCRPALCPLTNHRKRRKTERTKSDRRQCKRLWETCIRNIHCQTEGEIRLGRIQAKVLGIKSGHNLVYESASRKGSIDALNPLPKRNRSITVNKNSTHGISRSQHNKTDALPSTLRNSSESTTQNPAPLHNSSESTTQNPAQTNTSQPNSNHSKSLFMQISKTKLVKLEKDANLWREMKKTLKERKKHVGTKVGKKLIAMAVLHAPKLGLEAASTMMPLFVASFLADLGL